MTQQDERCCPQCGEKEPEIERYWNGQEWRTRFACCWEPTDAWSGLPAWVDEAIEEVTP